MSVIPTNTTSTTDSINKTVATTTATAKGTRIVKPGNEMDKNSFLRILSAELANQSPDNPADSTQYVAQMAQFASLEQMTNLNSSMSLIGASSIIGKVVGLNSANGLGEQYIGTVKGVAKESGVVNVYVEVTENQKQVIKKFPYDNVIEIA